MLVFLAITTLRKIAVLKDISVINWLKKNCTILKKDNLYFLSSNYFFEVAMCNFLWFHKIIWKVSIRHDLNDIRFSNFLNNYMVVYCIFYFKRNFLNILQTIFFKETQLVSYVYKKQSSGKYLKLTIIFSYNKLTFLNFVMFWTVSNNFHQTINNFHHD